MNFSKMVWFLAGMMLLGSSIAVADEKSVNKAYRLCAMLNTTDQLASGCDISEWKQFVDVDIDMTSSQAQNLCDGMVKKLANEGVRFSEGWEMRIYSPYKGRNSIATCPLPG